MTFNEKVEFYKEKIRKNPEKDIVVPHDVFHEVVFGEKPDYSLLEGFFDEDGKYIGGEDMKEYDEDIDKVYTPEEMEKFYEKLEKYDSNYILGQSDIKVVAKKWSEMSIEEKKDFTLSNNSSVTHIIYEKDTEDEMFKFQEKLLENC